jgi:hypothetical protein
MVRSTQGDVPLLFNLHPNSGSHNVSLDLGKIAMTELDQRVTGPALPSHDGVVLTEIQSICYWRVVWKAQSPRKYILPRRRLLVTLPPPYLYQQRITFTKTET